MKVRVLSGELMARIIGGDVSMGGYQAERRLSPRIPLHRRVRIVRLSQFGKGRPKPIVLRELSRTGVGLLANEEIRANDEFTLHIQIGRSGEETLCCRVVRCEPAPGDARLFLVGALFIETHSPAVRTQISELERIQDAILGK